MYAVDDTQYLYDRIGRQVGIIDANGNVPTQTWNNALNKVDMDGSVSHDEIVRYR